MDMLLANRLLTLTYIAFLIAVVVSATNRWYVMRSRWLREFWVTKPCTSYRWALLALWVNLSLRAKLIRWKTVWIPFGTLFLLVLATLEEFSPMFFVHRTFDLLDLACNVSEILLLGMVRTAGGSLAQH